MIFSAWDFIYLKNEAAKLVELLGLSSGMRLAEIGAGNGDLAVLLAEVVGDSGLVFATEHDEKKLNKLLQRVAQGKIKNLEAALAKDGQDNLPPIQFDAIVMKKVYHHFTDPEGQNRVFFEHLKSGGRLAIMDFEPKWYLKLSEPKGVPKNFGGHGIYKKVLVEGVVSAGFQLEKLDGKFSSGGMYCAVFVKP